MHLIVEHRFERKSDMPAFVAGLLLGAVIGFLIANLIAQTKPDQSSGAPSDMATPVQGNPPSGHKISPEEGRPAPATLQSLPSAPAQGAERPPVKKGPVVEATVPATPPTK